VSVEQVDPDGVVGVADVDDDGPPLLGIRQRAHQVGDEGAVRVEHHELHVLTLGSCVTTTRSSPCTKSGGGRSTSGSFCCRPRAETGLDGRRRDNAPQPGSVGAAACPRRALAKEGPYVAQDRRVVKADRDGALPVPERAASKLAHPALAQVHGSCNLSPGLALCAPHYNLLFEVAAALLMEMTTTATAFYGVALALSA
jgi:hypothetical protein